MIFIAISLGIIAFLTLVIMVLVPTFTLAEAIIAAIAIFVIVVYTIDQM